MPTHIRHTPRTRLMLAAMALLAVAPAALTATGCAPPPKRSTRLTADDLAFTAGELAARLGASGVLRDRGADEPPMVIAINRVENLTTDIIPAGEQWYVMARVRDAQPIRDLRERHNVSFVIPQEQLRRAREVGTLPENFADARNPTHEMSATFRSARRVAGLDRTDGYLCDLRLTSLATGEVVFTDTVEFKRAAFGRAYD
ncbi:MAG: hypothetical protein KF864_05345 [Phycisphaeraceae bacterium]|nr:hypothetical protein [Phycisphaeraceae bacterium]